MVNCKVFLLCPDCSWPAIARPAAGRLFALSCYHLFKGEEIASCLPQRALWNGIHFGICLGEAASLAQHRHLEKSPLKTGLSPSPADHQAEPGTVGFPWSCYAWLCKLWGSQILHKGVVPYPSWGFQSFRCHLDFHPARNLCRWNIWMHKASAAASQGLHM